MQNISRVQSDLFVSREYELNLFKEMLDPQSVKRIMNIHTEGAGGIGKTRLLLRMQELCDKESYVYHNPIMIDFYHTMSRSKLGVMQQIADTFDSEDFSDYCYLVKRYQEVEDRGKKEVQFAEIEYAFLDACKTFSEKTRAEGKIIILFFDTYECIQDIGKKIIGKTQAKPTELSKWLEKKLFAALKKSARLIIAGRYPLNETGSCRQDSISVNLKPFSFSETEAFWAECIRQYPDSKLSHITEGIRKRLHLLAAGRPVLLALLIDWINYAQNPLSPKKLLESIEKKTGKITTSVTSEQKHVFENTLIKRITSLSEPEDRAVVYLAFAYRRMTPEILSYLTGIHLSQSRYILLENLKPLSFVKYKESDIVLLHDEMRDLINRHWWEEQDEDKINRIAIAKKLVSYYDNYLSKKKLSLMEREILSADRLYYALYADIDQGMSEFLKNFDNSLINFRLELCELLLQEISSDQFYSSLPLKARKEIELRRIRCYNEQYRFDDALNAINILINETEEDRELFAEFIYERGIAYVWKNDFDEATLDFREAVKRFRGLKDRFSSAWALNWLGYSQLRNGEFQSAEETLMYSINEFLRLAKTPRSPKEEQKKPVYVGISNSYSNLSVVMRHTGRLLEATNYGEIAVAIADSKNNKRELIRFLNALGESYKMANKTFEASKAYERAFNLLESVSDKLLEARVLTGMGLLSYNHYEYVHVMEYYERGKEQKAVFKKYREIHPPNISKLLRARKILEALPPSRELADVYFDLAESYAVLENWQKAMEFFQRSQETAKTVCSAYRETDALIGLMTACYYAGESEFKTLGKEPYEKEIRTCIILIDALPLKYNNLEAKMRIVMGDFACEQYRISKSDDKLKETVTHYVLACNSMYLFNTDRFYSTIRILLKRLDSLFSDQSASPETEALIESLQELWYDDLGEKEVCLKYREKFDDILEFLLAKIKPADYEPENRMEYTRGIGDKVQDSTLRGRYDIGFAPFYGEILVLLTNKFGSSEEQTDAYRTLGRAYRLTDNIFEAQKNYEKALEISKELKNDFIRAPIYIGLGRNFYRRREYARTIEQYRREDIIANVARFTRDNKKEIEQAWQCFKAARIVIEKYEKTPPPGSTEIQSVAWLRAGLEFRWAELLLVSGGGRVNDEIESRLRKSVEKARESGRLWLAMDVIESLITYFYISDQWTAKEQDILDLYGEFLALNETRYAPLLQARMSVTRGDVKYDEIFDLFEKDNKDRDMEEIEKECIVLLEDAFTHYIEASRYEAEFSEKYFHESVRIILLRIAQLPKKAASLLYEKVYFTHFLYQKRPTGPVADKAFELAEQFMKIRSEVL
ncbi:MAG: hypothetical protein GY795_35605 [Desulfobacterales bacterium]|nr:hypothetical protein [Desulfobacterales bacterium]